MVRIARLELANLILVRDLFSQLNYTRILKEVAGFEPTRLGIYPTVLIKRHFRGGDSETQTHDLLRAKQAFSQLNYTPILNPVFRDETGKP